MAYIEDRIDCLEDRLCKLEKEVESLKSGIKLNNADIFSRLQHISDRVYGVPKDEPQVQQTTEEFVRVVRCKDCMYCKAYNDVWYRPKKDALICINDKTEVNADGYCSWGERRTDE